MMMLKKNYTLVFATLLLYIGGSYLAKNELELNLDFALSCLSILLLSASLYTGVVLWKEFNTEWITVDANILSLQEKFKSRTTNMSSTPHPIVILDIVYEYQVNGATYSSNVVSPSGKNWVLESYYRDLVSTDKSKAKISYMKNNPETSRLVNWNNFELRKEVIRCVVLLGIALFLFPLAFA